MSLPKVKTVVLVKDLIAAIERERDAAVAENRKRRAEALREAAQYPKLARAFVKSKLAEMSKPGFVLPECRYGDSLEKFLERGRPEPPEKPRADANISVKYDRLIQQLRLSVEPKVRLSPEDFANFMQGNSAACVC